MPRPNYVSLIVFLIALSHDIIDLCVICYDPSQFYLFLNLRCGEGGMRRGSEIAFR